MNYCGVSDNTIKRLIEAKLITAKQAIQYAPLEISKSDLDTPQVQGILKTLKTTGKLIVEGYSLEKQRSLFDENQ